MAHAGALIPSTSTHHKMTETITLAGGCFWCTEAVLKPLRGVESVTSGYSNGHVKNPTYREVCSGRTGHAEVVRVAFDPDVIALDDLMGIFFATHDPTTRDRQGADRGTQYRSAVFYETPEQKLTAERVVADLTAQGVFSDPIVTEITPLDVFYPAEDYHQEYFERNAEQPYCAAVIAPKVAKLRRHYLDRLAA